MTKKPYSENLKKRKREECEVIGKRKISARECDDRGRIISVVKKNGYKNALAMLGKDRRGQKKGS